MVKKAKTITNLAFLNRIDSEWLITYSEAERRFMEGFLLKSYPGEIVVNRDTCKSWFLMIKT